MNLRRGIAATCLVLAAIGTTAGLMAFKRAPAPVSTFILLGDSITKTTVNGVDSTVTARLSRAVGMRGIDVSVALANTDTLIARYKTTWKDTAAFAVVIAAGGLDFRATTAALGADSAVAVFNVERNLDLLVDTILKYQPATRIVVVSPATPFAWRGAGAAHDSTGVFAQRLRDVATNMTFTRGVAFADMTSGFTRGVDYAADGFNMTQLGSQRAANNIARALRREMCTGGFYSSYSSFTNCRGVR